MIFFLRAKARATQKPRAILRRRCNVCGWNSNACKAASSARLETSRALNKRVQAECPTYAERSSSEEILVKNWGLVTPRPLVFTTATSSLERRCFRRLNAQIPKRGHGGKRRVPKDNPKNHPHMSSGSNVISPCAQSKKAAAPVRFLAKNRSHPSWSFVTASAPYTRAISPYFLHQPTVWDAVHTQHPRACQTSP